MIHHLVLSGGANIGFAFIGSLSLLLERNILDIQHIQSIHSTSIGTLIGTSLSLGYSIDEIKTYMLDRPWHELYKINIGTCYSAIQEGGILGMDVIKKSLEPLLLGKNLSIDLTLAELYAYSNIDFHYYTTDFSSLEMVDISHQTHPQWTVVESIYASSCLPILFRPLLKENTYYIDGAVIMNYPLIKCLESVEDEKTILGLYLCLKSSSDETKEWLSRPYTVESSYKLLDYGISLCMKMWERIKHKQTEKEKLVLHQIPINCEMTITNILKCIESKEERYRLYQVGVQSAYHYYGKEDGVESH